MDALLQKLAHVTFKDEIKELRRVCHDEQLKLELDQHSDFDHRIVALRLAIFSGDEKRLHKFATADPSRAIQKLALTAVGRCIDDESVLQVFRKLNHYDRRALIKVMYNTRKRFALIDKLLGQPDLGKYEVRHLLSFGSPEFVESVIQEHYQWLDLMQWGGLSKRHPRICLRQALKMASEEMSCPDDYILEYCRTAIRNGFQKGGDLVAQIVIALHKYYPPCQLPVREAFLVAPATIIAWILEKEVELSTDQVPCKTFRGVGVPDELFIQFCQRCPWITRLGQPIWSRVSNEQRNRIYLECRNSWPLDKVHPEFFHTLCLEYRAEMAHRKIAFDEEEFCAASNWTYHDKHGHWMSQEELDATRATFIPSARWWSQLPFSEARVHIERRYDQLTEHVKEHKCLPEHELDQMYAELPRLACHHAHIPAFQSLYTYVRNGLKDGEIRKLCKAKKGEPDVALMTEGLPARMPSKMWLMLLSHLPLKLISEELFIDFDQSFLQCDIAVLKQLNLYHLLHPVVSKCFFKWPAKVMDRISKSDDTIGWLHLSRSPLLPEEGLRQLEETVRVLRDETRYNALITLVVNIAAQLSRLPSLEEPLRAMSLTLRNEDCAYRLWGLRRTLAEAYDKNKFQTLQQGMEDFLRGGDKADFSWEHRIALQKSGVLNKIDRQLFTDVIERMTVRGFESERHNLTAGYPCGFGALCDASVYVYLTPTQRKVLVKHLLVCHNKGLIRHMVDKEVDITDASFDLTNDDFYLHSDLAPLALVAGVPDVKAETLMKWAEAKESKEEQWQRSKVIEMILRADDRRAFETVTKFINEYEDPRDMLYGICPLLKNLERQEALALLRSVNMGRVSVAKETIRLMGWLKMDEARLHLIELFDRKDPPLHKDARIAIIRAMWNYLQDEDTWAFLDRAVHDPDWRISVKISHITAFRISPTAKRRLLHLIRLALSNPEEICVRKCYERYDFRPEVTDPEGIRLPAYVKILCRPDFASHIRDQTLRYFAKGVRELHEDSRCAAISEALAALAEHNPEMLSAFSQQLDGLMPEGQNALLISICRDLVNRLLTDFAHYGRLLDTINLCPTMDSKLEIYRLVISRCPALRAYMSVNRHDIWRIKSEVDRAFLDKAAREHDLPELEYVGFSLSPPNWLRDIHAVASLRERLTADRQHLTCPFIAFAARDTKLPGETVLNDTELTLRLAMACQVS